MDHGEEIKTPFDFLFVCEYNMWNIYISKRALKHFVESRKKAFYNKNIATSLEYMDFIIDNIKRTLIVPNYIEIRNSRRVVFVRDYHSIGKPCLRIILDIVSRNRLEICSMHFQKKL